MHFYNRLNKGKKIHFFYYKVIDHNKLSGLIFKPTAANIIHKEAVWAVQ